MDMYVYAENDYMARKRSHEIADNIKSPNNRATVLDIVEQPFGKLGNRKLKDISRPSSREEMPF